MLHVVDMSSVQSEKLNKENCSVNVIIWDATAINKSQKSTELSTLPNTLFV